MASVTLLRPDMRAPLTVEVRSQEKRTLLSLLVQEGAFDPSLCDQKRCGECAVKVVSKVYGDKPPLVKLGAHEKKVLFESDKLSLEQYESKSLPAVPPLWRIACEYVLRYEEIIVAM